MEKNERTTQIVIFSSTQKRSVDQLRFWRETLLESGLPSTEIHISKAQKCIRTPGCDIHFRTFNQHNKGLRTDISIPPNAVHGIMCRSKYKPEDCTLEKVLEIALARREI